MAKTLEIECKKFEKCFLSVNVTMGDVLNKMNYLHDFLKLLFYNVKRPFLLYEVCLKMIIDAHLLDRLHRTQNVSNNVLLMQYWKS